MKSKPLSVHDIEVRNVYDSCGLKIEENPIKRGRMDLRLVQTWGRGDKGEWSADMGICKVCACEIDPTPDILRFGGHTEELKCHACHDCMTLVREKYYGTETKEADATATPKWDEKCPERHKQVALGEVRPPRIDWTAYEKVLAWEPSAGRGLILTGAPGTGKTSAFWALARVLESGGHSPITLSSLEAGRALAEAAKDIREVGWMYRCRVLMIDDLGKERATPGVAAMLWEVLDRRLSANLPVILTTNFSGEELARRFGEEHLGDSVRRRISELCRRVQFGVPVETQTTQSTHNQP